MKLYILVAHQLMAVLEPDVECSKQEAFESVSKNTKVDLESNSAWL